MRRECEDAPVKLRLIRDRVETITRDAVEQKARVIVISRVTPIIIKIIRYEDGP